MSRQLEGNPVKTVLGLATGIAIAIGALGTTTAHAQYAQGPTCGAVRQMSHIAHRAAPRQICNVQRAQRQTVVRQRIVQQARPVVVTGCGGVNPCQQRRVASPNPCGANPCGAAAAHVPVCNESLVVDRHPGGNGWVPGINPNSGRCVWVHGGRVPIVNQRDIGYMKEWAGKL